jgi:hypothetical protein
VSASTAAGGWKAPTRFLPAAVLMPVFPPTAASTMPSTLVGTWTIRMPRVQVAATKPARSVTAPPPTPTTASDLVSPSRPNSSQSSAATSTVFAASPSGTTTASAATPAVCSVSTAAPASAASGGVWTTAARAVPARTRPSSAVAPGPMTTS